MRLLLFSNSTNAGEEYLAYPVPYIHSFLGTNPRKCAFIPFAGVTISYDDYEQRVRARFLEAGHSIESVHANDQPIALIQNADAIVVGGGNTWQLLKKVYETGLYDVIVEEVRKGKPYIGWSAGSNLACPTIMTTNDMPITQPPSWQAFGLIPFQINPHYTDANPDGHAGETREDRIREFIEMNQNTCVLGLREGTLLNLENHILRLYGTKPARVFNYGRETVELEPNSDLTFLL